MRKVTQYATKQDFRVYYQDTQWSDCQETIVSAYNSENAKNIARNKVAKDTKHWHSISIVKVELVDA